jgi:hypothetical protein
MQFCKKTPPPPHPQRRCPGSVSPSAADGRRLHGRAGRVAMAGLHAPPVRARAQRQLPYYSFWALGVRVLVRGAPPPPPRVKPPSGPPAGGACFSRAPTGCCWTPPSYPSRSAGHLPDLLEVGDRGPLPRHESHQGHHASRPAQPCQTSQSPRCGAVVPAAALASGITVAAMVPAHRLAAASMADKIAHDLLFSLFSTMSLCCSSGRRWERCSRGPGEASVFEEVMPGVRLVDADAFHLFHVWAPRLRGLG